MTLREARFKRGITQWDLAVKTKLSQTKISVIENGFKLPEEADKEKIADVLCFNVVDIEYKLKES